VTPLDYWIESLASSFEEHGIVATSEQIARVAADMQVSSENQGQAFYTPPNPMIRELDETKKLLAAEKAKVGCPTCRGKGYVVENFMNRSSTSQCDKCHGEGKITP